MVRMSGTDSAASKRARLAVSEFRKMQTTLEAFARAITNQPKLRIIVDPGVPRTDGKNIYYPPPIELANQTKHDVTLCDRRDENTLAQLCGACRVREDVFTVIFHEISHIAFGTFVEPERADIARALKYARVGVSPAYADRISRRVMQAPKLPISYLELSNSINPYLYLLNNSLEDARINSRMMKARPGTTDMQRAQLRAVMVDGIEKTDGTRTYWKDMHLNHQAAIACFCVASDYTDLDEVLHPDVVKAVKDPHLQMLLASVTSCTSSLEAFEVTWDVFIALRDMGFYELKEEADEPAESNDADEDSGDSPSVPTPPQPSPPQSSGDAGQPGDPSPADPPADGSGEADDEVQSDAGADEADDEDAPGESSEEGDGAGDEQAELPADGGSDQPSDEGAGSDESSEVPAEPEAVGDEETAASDGSVDSDLDDRDADDRDGSSDRAHDGSDAGSDNGDDEAPGEGEPEGDEGAEAGDGDGDGEDDPWDDGESEPVRVVIEADEDAENADLEDLGLHKHSEELSRAEQQAIKVAIVQGEYFEKPSANVAGVKEWYFDTNDTDRSDRRWHAWQPNATKMQRQYDGMSFRRVEESVLAPALLRMRVVFAENKRTIRNRNLKSGRITTRTLGKRAWGNDDRLFGKKIVPGKKDYIVYICLDVSGSTEGDNLRLIKQAAAAQADMCARMGIKFAVYAHTGSPESNNDHGQLWVDIYHVKDSNQPWDDAARRRLDDLAPSYGNLDGHTLEFYRKQMDREQETDRIIMYYTDGAMPASNYAEELDILQREIQTCRQKRYTLMGVGIRTDSPIKHGLDTVQVDSAADVRRVVDHLEKRLLAW